MEAAISTSNLPTIAELTEGYDLTGGLLPKEVDFQGWNSEHSIFDDLVNDTQPKRLVEVGSWKGASARHLAKATEGLGTEIYCVDTWLGGIDHYLSKLPQDDRLLDRFGSPGLYRQFIRNFVGTDAAKRIHPIQTTSTNGAKVLAHYGMQADLIYIDGSHEYDDVYADLCAYMPLLSSNGVMFGDDFRMGGVFAAVIRFAHEHSCRMQEIDHNFWVLR